MYYDDQMAFIMGMMIFYFIFLGLWWLLAAIAGHALLNKKGYRHAGLYVLAWFPMLNWMAILLFVGLPDALLNRKVDYLLRQMAASGMIQAPPMQPAYMGAPMGAPVSAPASATMAPQAAAPTAQPAWQQHQQTQQAGDPVNPQDLFGPGSGQNNS